MPKRPHRLRLYQQAVQHPQAEVAFALKAYAHHRGKIPPPTLLREDFAGSAAVAAAWVAFDADHQAMAIESHAPTVRWAGRHTLPALGRRADDLHLLHADVLAARGPKVDITLALNFSCFIYHTRDDLRAYFRHARRCLRDRGLLIIDAYGGPGAMRAGTQWRTVQPPDAEPFEYGWEQRGYDAVTQKVDCRIHFRFVNGDARPNAFRYDWRLWSLTELRELMLEAGFAGVHIWCDRFDLAAGLADGQFRPRKSIPAREDFVAYVVGLR